MMKTEDAWDIIAVENTGFRDSGFMTNLLNGSFAAFCNNAKGIRLSATDIQKLEMCRVLGIYPIQLAVNHIERPNQNITAYTYFPPDILHTILSGLFRDWIVFTFIIGNYVIFMYTFNFYVI